MTRACPYCGNVSESLTTCNHCKKDIGWLNNLNYKSEAYYTKAYYYAGQRDFTKAIHLLKKAVALNTYHIEAKNLLGLIYFEMGDIGEALKLWILSQSLKKEENRAQNYIEAIQNDPRKFEHYKEAADLYNKSLKYLKQKNEDMAIIRLKKAVNLNRHFVEAKNLLALCYIYQKQFYKAEEQIKDVLKIDRTNTKALYYLNLIHGEENLQESTNKKSPSKKSPLNNANQAVSHYKPQKILNRENILISAIVYFVFGALCMLAVQMILILPSKTQGLETKLYEMTNHKIELEEQFEKSKKEMNAQLGSLQKEIEAIKEKNKELQTNNNKVTQQNRLVQTKELISQGEWVKAAEIFYNISTGELSAEDLNIYEGLKEDVLERAAGVLYDTGYGSYRNGQGVEAVADFEKVVLYRPGTWMAGQALYYMGQIQEGSNVQKAKQHYTTLITDYAGTEVAYQAQKRIEELNGQN